MRKRAAFELVLFVCLAFQLEAPAAGVSSLQQGSVSTRHIAEVVEDRPAVNRLAAQDHATPSIPETGFVHIAVLSDLHLPGRILAKKRRALETLNAWPDLHMAVLLGDICEDHGSGEEYAFARQFLTALAKPTFPVAGNHEYIYYDTNPFNPEEKVPKGKHVVAASASLRREKLKRFKDTFALPELYYAKTVGSYRLVFLSTDHLYVSYRTAISDAQLEWFRSELAQHRATPTIVFFHGPLQSTIAGANLVNHDPVNYMAQPHREIRAILRDNPQVFLWASGHAHLAPMNANYHHPVSHYERQITNIHTPDMNGSSYISEHDRKSTKHETVWTNSLFLHRDKVVVKTFDHEEGSWMETLTRTIKPPTLTSRRAPGSPQQLLSLSPAAR